MTDGSLKKYDWWRRLRCLTARRYAERGICYANSVCPSVTRVYCIKTAEHILEILSASDRPIILVYGHQTSLRKSDGFTPNGGAEYKGVAIFDQYAAISEKRLQIEADLL